MVYSLEKETLILSLAYHIQFLNCKFDRLHVHGRMVGLLHLFHVPINDVVSSSLHRVHMCCIGVTK